MTTKTSFVCLALAMAVALPDAWAGGDLGGPDDHHEDEGPSFFGFVKDARGAPIPDAKVTANVKNGVSFITHTTAIGMYKIGGFSKQVNPDEITISCAKDGYRQARVFRRTLPKAKSEDRAIETECRMERS
jgi:hypothetical protein